jgi:translation initiation factor 4G
MSNIRDATEADLDFIAWAIHTAGRSHLARSPWEYVSGQTQEQVQAFHRRVAGTDAVHMNHWSVFLIAEVDGRPAATLCGYDADTQGSDAVLSVAADIAVEQGVVLDDAFFERFAINASVHHDDLPGAWVIENVATRPEFRGRGLVRELLAAVLDRGRERGFTTAQVSVFIGNDAARDAYLALGFEPVAEARDPAFEAAMGSPGMEQLLLAL